MRKIEITIESLITEGVNIQDVQFVPGEIELALKQMINENGYPSGIKSDIAINITARPLNYTDKLKSSTIAERIAKSIYPHLENATAGRSGVDLKTGKNSI